LDHRVLCDPTFLLGLADLKICRSDRAWRGVRIAFSVRVHDAKIVLGVLVQVFSGNPVTARRRLPCERNVTLKHLISIAPDFDVRTITVESLDPIGYPRTVMMVVIPVVAAA
jgi:hypothetical protein